MIVSPWLRVSIQGQGGPKRAAHAADQGVMAAPWAGGGGHANARRLACRAEDQGRRDDRQVWAERGAAADRHGLGDAAELPAPGRRRGPGRVAGCGYCASGGGAPAPGWPRTPSPSPRASRADPRRRPPAWVPSVKAVLTWRAPAAARSHGGRVEGDGMAEPQGGCGMSSSALTTTVHRVGDTPGGVRAVRELTGHARQ